MTFGATPKDASQIPISCVYVPGVGFVPLQGSTLTNTDGSSNQSTPANFNVAQIGSVATQMGTSDVVTPANVIEFVPGLYNGSSGATIDRQRGNVDSVGVLNVSGGTITQTGADMTNYNHRGGILVLDMTNVGTGSVTLEIDGKEPISGKYYTILTGVAITTISTNIYRVYPGLTAVANATVNDVLPRTWRVKVTANNANATTYTVSAMLIL